ncbi:hypothetical protein FZEAL_6820 [Fusarium zealandicum]|uniref:alpha-L-rhamnosidase n=1 Tax=Fusarium zealandicum TaxID=1053134 RepID=A0A8H4UH02_9HYPO|nr:hypothetical protein FZEAL_6820 [Fusarium zealandicum]
MALSISRVTFEHHRTALGIAEAEPRISWRFDGNVSDWEQSAYDVEITGASGAVLNTFSFNSSTSLYIPWPDSPLEEAEPAAVRVRAHGLHHERQPSTPWSDWVSVETCISNQSWVGMRPITSAQRIDVNETKRPIYFRKAFDLPDKVASARLYITALGIYEAEINGNRSAIGAVVGEGWYAGRMGFGGGQRNVHGNYAGLLLQLVVTMENRSSFKARTDETWKSNYGPAIRAEIYDGEEYDDRLAASIEGWSTGQYDSSSWYDTRLLPPLKGQLVPPDQPPVRRIEEVKLQRFFKSPSGKTLVDFGQNLVGWLRLKVDGPANTTIKLHHAEVLENGELALRPLREAKAEDIVHLSGSRRLEWEPKFTYHGFRYAQIDGWPEETPLDEGDAHAFGPTSNFLYDTAGFWKSWHKAVWSEMSAEDSMIPPVYVPTLPSAFGGNSMATSVWGDVVVGNPWNIYKAFGDRGLLNDHLPQAQGWIDTGISRNGDGLWNRSSFQFGDWLDPVAPPDKPGDATTHTMLVSDAYLTAYALALEFDLLNGEKDKANAVTILRDIVKENDHLMGTGFAGTPALGFALRRNKATEDFYRMLLQEKVPSWLYQVVEGGTTIWERWDSLLPNGTVNPGEMTSFNHYAFGSVADWIHQVIGGIAPAEPGYRKVAIAPVPGGGISHASAVLMGPYGEIKTAWWVDGDGFHMKIKIPPNTRAEVTMPGASKAQAVGSGSHEFHDPSYEVDTLG